MVKVVGGVRPLSRNGTAYQNRLEEYRGLMQSDAYSTGYFSVEGGGYFLVEDSPAKHKTEELEAAKHLADNGYKVILKNEAGSHNTVDGKVFNLTYEQRTPTKDAPTTIRNALFHARDKWADVAVIYSKGHAFTRESVEKGIKLYEDAVKDKRFEKIIVVADNGHVHVHKHRK